MNEHPAVLAPKGAHLPHRGTRVIERPGWYQVITPGARGANEVLFSTADADVAAIAAEYTERFKWCVWPWADGLAAPLRARGFEIHEAQAMFADASLAVAAPADVTVEEVTTPDQLAVYVDTLAAGWDETPAERDELAACLPRVLAEPARVHRFYIAWCAGEPVGTGGLCYRPALGAVYLTGGNVLAAHRGRGAYRALIAARIADARGALVTTHARVQTSAPILERLGFATAVAYRVFLSPRRV
jgi:acetyltransferase (GNAT) family protein